MPDERCLKRRLYCMNRVGSDIKIYRFVILCHFVLVIM